MQTACTRGISCFTAARHRYFCVTNAPAALAAVATATGSVTTAAAAAACALLAFPDDDIISLNERTCESQIETHQWSQLMHQQ